MGNTLLPSPLADFGLSALGSYQLIYAIFRTIECDLPHNQLEKNKKISHNLS
jgi:hypothetical protein